MLPTPTERRGYHFTANDFGNQMATFHLFKVSLDLNMDRYAESVLKRDPNHHHQQPF
jgi:hypothetical protein